MGVHLAIVFAVVRFEMLPEMRDQLDEGHTVAIVRGLSEDTPACQVFGYQAVVLGLGCVRLPRPKIVIVAVDTDDGAVASLVKTVRRNSLFLRHVRTSEKEVLYLLVSAALPNVGRFLTLGSASEL